MNIRDAHREALAEIPPAQRQFWGIVLTVALTFLAVKFGITPTPVVVQPQPPAVTVTVQPAEVRLIESVRKEGMP